MIRSVAVVALIVVAGCSNAPAEGPESLLKVAMVEDQNCSGGSAYLQNVSRKHALHAVVQETVVVGEGEPVRKSRTFTAQTGARQFLGCQESPAGEGVQKKSWEVKVADYLS